jgi:hypothetical protein
VKSEKEVLELYEQAMVRVAESLNNHDPGVREGRKTTQHRQRAIAYGIILGKGQTETATKITDKAEDLWLAKQQKKRETN